MPECYIAEVLVLAKQRHLYCLHSQHSCLHLFAFGQHGKVPIQASRRACQYAEVDTVKDEVIASESDC